jgi:hypothetical protein
MNYKLTTDLPLPPAAQMLIFSYACAYLLFVSDSRASGGTGNLSNQSMYLPTQQIPPLHHPPYHQLPHTSRYSNTPHKILPPTTHWQRPIIFHLAHLNTRKEQNYAKQTQFPKRPNCCNFSNINN